MEVHSSNGQRGATLIALAAIIADVCHLVRDDQMSATLPRRREGLADPLGRSASGHCQSNAARPKNTS
jgi:hypothetical protein